MTTNNFNQPVDPKSLSFLLTDSLIRLGFFVLGNMFVAFLVKLCMNRILSWYELPTVEYGVALAIWFLWLMFFIIPIYYVASFVAIELSVTFKTLLTVLINSMSSDGRKMTQKQVDEEIIKNVLLKD